MMLAEVARAATNDVWLGVGCVDAEKKTTKRQKTTGYNKYSIKDKLP